MKREEDILFEKFGNKLPYTVPENYFDNFVAQWSKEQAVAVPRVVQMRHVARTWLYMAAMFVGVFFMGHFIYNSYNSHNSGIQDNLADNYELYMYSQITDTDVIDYCLTALTD